MADLVYTIKAGTVNGTTEFNSINAAVTYFKAGDRMGAGVGTVSAGDRLDLVFEGFLDFAGSTQILSGITLANNATSRVRMRGGANRWNASPSNAAGVTATRDGFKVNSSAQFTASPGQPGLEIVDLVIEGGSTGNYLLHLFGSSSARGLVQGCLILLNTGAAMSYGTISTGYTDFRRNFVILANAGADSVGMRAGGFDDPSLFDHNTVVCLPSAPTGSYGMRLDGSGHTARNNVVVGFATDYNGAGFGTATGNASSDATAPGSSALTSVAKSTANFESVTGSGDFRVKATSVLKTTGAARLATELVDAYGQTRADPATIGAHEAGVVPPDTTPPDITSTGTGSTNGPFSANVAENSTAAFITLTASENVTWGALGGADASRFVKLNETATTVQLGLNPALNFESLPHANPFVVTVPATDAASNLRTVTVNASVTNVNEPPNAPTIGTATAGNASASVAFTPGAANGGPSTTGYTATSSPGGITGTGASSPITVSGITNGVAYTFSVTATNSEGTSSPSAASNSVTPTAPGGGSTLLAKLMRYLRS